MTIPTENPPLLSYRQPTLAIPEDWTDARVYGYRPEMAASMYFSRAIRYIIFLGLFVPLVMFFEWRVLGADFRRSGVLLCGMAGFFTCAAGVRLWRMKQLIDRQWPTFRVVIADQGVVRACQGFPDLVIPLAEIKQAREYPGQGIAIRGRNRLQLIWIPAKYMENYADLRVHLGGIRPLEVHHRRWLLVTRQIVAAVLVLTLLLGAWAWGVFSRDLREELLCLSILLGLVAWSNIHTWRNPNIMLRHKIGSLILILLPLELLVKIILIHR